MVKKSDNSLVAPFAVSGGGADGGGWVTGINIADDGYKVVRNDTNASGYIRGPSDSRWTPLFRFGDNVPATEFVFRGPASFHDVDICATDSTFGIIGAEGRLYKTTDRFATVARLTTFKSGTYDQTFGYQNDISARFGGQHIRIDPVNKNNIAVGHPVDGGYVSTDGGATAFAIPASLPAPINSGAERRQVRWAVDRSSSNGTSCLTWFCMIPGRGVYRTTTGLGGTWSLLSGGPTACTSMAASGGKLYVCGDGYSNDSQLFVHNGTSFSQPSGVTGVALTVNRSDATKIIVMRVGGGTWYSTDTAATWNLYDFPGVDASGPGGECPWLAATGLAYVATGAIGWEVRSGVNRLWICCGIGTFYLDNPPRTTSGTKYTDRTLGIKQMLLKSATITPKGTLLCVGEDRPLWRFPRGGQTVQATGHGPNYNFAIRHGGDIDFAPEDENYVVGTYSEGGGGAPTYAVSLDNGKTWAEGIGPSLTRPDSLTFKAFSGNVAVTGIGKFTWASTSGGAVRYTLNGGSTWLTPVFKDEGGTVIDQSLAITHWAYTLRRKVLVSDKATPGRAFIFFDGSFLTSGGSLSYSASLVGLFETLDHGATWTRIRATNWLSGGTDFFAAKLRLVPGNANHMFFAVGTNGSYPAPVDGNAGFYFSTDKGATKIEMTGFQEVEDVSFTLRPTNRTYPRIWVKGWRTVSSTLTYGIWYSDDFNSASPLSATWTFFMAGPDGRLENDVTMAGDMGSYPGLTLIMQSGGFFVYEDPVTLKAS